MCLLGGYPPTVIRGRKLSNPVVCGTADKNLCSLFCPGPYYVVTDKSQVFHFCSAEALIF